MKTSILGCFIFLNLWAGAQKGIALRDSLFRLFDGKMNAAQKYKIWEELEDSYNNAGLIDSSELAQEQLLKIAAESGNDSLLAMVYTSLGTHFCSTGDYKQALEYHYKSIELAEKKHYMNTLWLATKETAVVYKRLNNLNEALKYLKRSAVYLPQTDADLPAKMNRYYTNLSDVFLGLGDNDSALKYIQAANEVTKKDSDVYGYGRTLYLFAGVYKAQGDLDLADSYYRKCIAFCDSESVTLPFITSTADYGKMLAEQGHFEQAKKYGLMSMLESRKTANSLGIIEAASLLKKIYSGLGQKDSAYFYADVKDSYRDSLFNDAKLRNIQNISFAQQIREKESDAVALNAETQRKLNIQYSMIALGIVFFILLFLMLSRSIVANEKWISFLGVLGLLVVFEFVNMLIHPTLAEVTHESPVLMLLALVALASLLIPMHHRIEKWIKSKMVEKNRRIRLDSARRTIEQLSDGEELN